jgi:PAS domain S-box-containing protein
VIGLGSVVLIGWVTGVDALRRLAPGVVAMNPATACALVLSGWSLLLSRPNIPGPRCQTARLLATLVAAAGMVKLIGLAAKQFLPMDTPSVLDAVMELREARPEGISPIIALDLVLAGTALWLMNCSGRRRQAPAQMAALGSALLSMVALVGYAYKLTDVSGDASLIPMAPQTALSFAALSLGILFARPGRGLMAIVTRDSPGAEMARRIVPACVLVPILLGWLAVAGERSGWVSVPTAVALMVAATIVVFLGFTWGNAGLIDRTEDERVQANQALRESEVFYHSLVETLPQNILRKDRDGRFTFVNRRFCETVGRPFEEIVGRTDFDLFPAPLAEKYRADDQAVMESENAFEVVEEHVTPDGQTHYVQVIKIPLRDAAGQVIGVQGIFWDVTERRRTEVRLREQNEQLLTLAASERRAYEELKSAQSRMVQAAKLAGLGEMVAGVAHEINNPLSYVGNNVAVLQRDLAEIRELIALYRELESRLAQVDPQGLAGIREYCERTDMEYTLENLEGLLERTREGLRRIQRIVGDLRIFARLDEGEVGEVDLNAGIESTISIVLGNAKKKHVSVDVDLAPLPLVPCFGAKINQVVMNLISNAIDACDEGGHISIRTRVEDEGVRIEVEDDGCGIPPEVRERIFDPFFTTKPVGVGTGLGLSISYGIVQDHGGTIEVDSPPGSGTKFVVHLPRDATPHPRVDPDETPRFADPSTQTS